MKTTPTRKAYKYVPAALLAAAWSVLVGVLAQAGSPDTALLAGLSGAAFLVYVAPWPRRRTTSSPATNLARR